MIQLSDLSTLLIGALSVLGVDWSTLVSIIIMNSSLGIPTRMEREKLKVVVIMGATGSGKSKLAVDLANYFPMEIVNADSMQVYHGLDVLTNKLSIDEQKGVPHHLLGSVSPHTEYTAKEFRDSALTLIDEIASRGCLPVIVGGTNYYIQALVSPYLLDDRAENLTPNAHFNGCSGGSFLCSYEYLKHIDPVAASRVHPNNNRKINQFLRLYEQLGILPSNIYEEKTAEKWGSISNGRYNCCFICIDVASSVLDSYVNQRVDHMINGGLLYEIYEIYDPNANYTQGLRQAIGVREFDDFLRVCLVKMKDDKILDSIKESLLKLLLHRKKKELNGDIEETLSFLDTDLKIMLAEAIEKVKTHTRRLVRSQKRRLARLRTLFGWNIHNIDATECASCKSSTKWSTQVVAVAVGVIGSFLADGAASSSPTSEPAPLDAMKLAGRNLWTQFICKACGGRVLRGGHEWEQHKQGRGHRKRVSRLRKSAGVLRLPPGGGVEP